MSAEKVPDTVPDAMRRGEMIYRMRNDMSQTAFALGAFRAKHGSYPRALARLKPEVLSVLPQDEFADADLQYRPLAHGYVLYSVGPDGEDDGARRAEDSRNGDLPVIQVPPKMGE